MDVELISETLEAMADPHVARQASRQTHTLRGIRGTPHGEIARIGAAAWQEHHPTPRDEDALRQLFMAAYEDGLVAIGMLSTLVPKHPGEALDIGLSWLDLVDEVETADALGWLVLGPGFAATGPEVGRLEELLAPKKTAHVAVRRAMAAMALAFLPIPVTGPAAAPLRQALSSKHLQFVDQPLSPLVATICTTFVRDEAPQVRKVLRRILRLWAKLDPAATVAWEQSVRGGLPKFLSAETKKARGRV